jgi:outer membrane protein OmpA-like peptidoglycan-associated protein
MLKRFKIIFIYLLLSLTVIHQSHCQTISTDNDFLLQNFILSLDAGVSYGFSDYINSTPGPAVNGSIEYYPIIIQNARLGFKAFAGGLTLKFDDTRNLISTNDGQREIPNHISTDAIQIGIGVTFGYVIGDYVIPSITVGGSFLRFSPKDSDGKVRPFNGADVYKKDIMNFYLEGELKVKISDRLSINTQLSYYPTSTDYLEDVSAATNNDTYLTGMLGISYALSGNFDSDGDGVSNDIDLCPDTPREVKVDEFGCPIDSDNDGVPDYLDKCSNTLSGVKVDINGCPLDTDNDGVPDYLDKCPDTSTNLEVDSTGCPMDSDNDGVPDYKDLCKDTPPSVTVDESGCSIDSDKDGVPDYLDKCPDTPTNLKVDSTGCSDEMHANTETFYQFILRGDDTFKANTDTLIELAKVILDEIASYIKSQTGSKWRIEGYTDNQGSKSVLKKLSYNQAKSTLNYLMSKGLSNDQFTIFGLGDSFPIANNNTPEGRSTNRRILIIRED